MSRYRSEPLHTWNWEEKSPLFGHGKGPRIGQGINSSPSSKKTHKARREISQGKGGSGTATYNIRVDFWKIKNIRGGR